MKKIYIAGPYSAGNIMQVLKNISVGQKMAVRLLSYGFAVYCPFVDYQFAILESNLSKELFQKNSMEWVKVSDAMILLPGWEGSGGTLREIVVAEKHGVRVFEDFNDLLRWKVEAE